MGIMIFIVFGLMIAVVGVVLLGVFNLARGGEGSGERSNKLMVLRVGLQALALILLFFLFAHGGSAPH